VHGDDPYFTEVDRVCQKINDHPPDDEVFKIRFDQSGSSNILDLLCVRMLPGLFGIESVHVLVEDAALCPGHFSDKKLAMSVRCAGCSKRPYGGVP